MGERYNRFRRKLTEESATYIAQRKGCGGLSADIVKEVQDKFDIKISTERVNKLCTTKRWNEVYLISQAEYHRKLGDFTGMAIAVQRTRLEEGEKIRKKLFRVIESLEKRILKDGREMTRFELLMTNSLKGLMETYFKALEYGRKETEVKTPPPSEGSSFNDFMKNAKTVNAEVVKPVEPKMLPESTDVN